MSGGINTPQSLPSQSLKRGRGREGRRSGYSHPTPPLSSSSLGWPNPSLACASLRAQTVLVPVASHPLDPDHPPPPCHLISLSLKQPGCIIYLSLCYCLEIMKGAVGMLNHCVLGFCLVNEWMGWEGGERRRWERGRGRWGGSKRVRQGKTIVKGTLFLEKKIQLLSPQHRPQLCEKK